MPQRFTLFKMGPSLDNKSWTCCFGLHVRTATVMIGIWHLLLNFCILLLLVVVLRHPEMLSPDDRIELQYNFGDDEAPELPTPLSKVETKYAYRDANKLIEQRLDMGVMGCVCMMAITMFMISGALKGLPARLLPFFCVQLFDFAVTTLTATSYACYMRNIPRMLAESVNMPFREELLQLNPNVLVLLVLLSFIGTVLLKAYIIGIVWRCHKFLTMRQHHSQMMLPYVISDAANGTGATAGIDYPTRTGRDYSTLLPGYEEALAQSLKQQPPPSYQAAVSGAAALEQQQQQLAGHVTVVLPPAQPAANAPEGAVPSVPTAVESQQFIAGEVSAAGQPRNV